MGSTASRERRAATSPRAKLPAPLTMSVATGKAPPAGAGAAHQHRDEMAEHCPHRAAGADQEQLPQHHLPTRKWHTSPSCMT